MRVHPLVARDVRERFLGLVRGLLRGRLAQLESWLMFGIHLRRGVDLLLLILPELVDLEGLILTRSMAHMNGLPALLGGGCGWLIRSWVGLLVLLRLNLRLCLGLSSIGRCFLLVILLVVHGHCQASLLVQVFFEVFVSDQP